MQLVFEFGSPQVAPIVNAIRSVMGRAPYSIERRPKGSDVYEPTTDSLELTATALESGHISAFIIRPTQGGLIRYALALGPNLDRAKRSFYLGTIEYTEKNWAPIWELILGTTGLIVATLGFEEGTALDDARLSAETFPWNCWPLIIGAVRESSRPGWIVREGPEMKWFASIA